MLGKIPIPQRYISLLQIYLFMPKISYSSNTKWEKEFSYSRAVRSGSRIIVAGTTAMQDGNIIGINDACAQTTFILNKIEKVIEEAGGKRSDIVRTRMYVTDISKHLEVGKSHGNFFSNINPASTMVEVSALIHPDLLIEIEAEAIID